MLHVIDTGTEQKQHGLNDEGSKNGGVRWTKRGRANWESSRSFLGGRGGTTGGTERFSEGIEFNGTKLSSRRGQKEARWGKKRGGIIKGDPTSA